MITLPKTPIFSKQSQLNLLGIFVLALFSLAVWNLAQNLTLSSGIILFVLCYGFLRIVYELTINRRHVPTLATSFMGRRLIAKYLKKAAETSQSKPYRVLDLGSGCGELSLAIARSIPSAQITGIEFARIPFFKSKILHCLFRTSNTTFLCCDLFSHDCSTYDAIVFYMSGSMAKKIGEKLVNEMKSGGDIISHTFPLLGEWTPFEIVTYRSPFKETLYIYRKK